MKIPALRSNIGDWNYYVTTLTFEQVREFVSRVDDELHNSKELKDLIQRSITNNYISIKEYILNQPEFFFNSLVLAVYDDYPIWREIEFKYDDVETYQMGLLEFPGTHKIFPVDGQHRVEGIKAALLQDPSLKENKISAIFIGHKNDEEGLQKTRRLFSTLNRYAKPVTLDDIIALDEDDSVAIATRYLLENHSLFKEGNITKSKNKAIVESDKTSFTSIITLYECNKELLKCFRKELKISAPNNDRDKKSLKDYLKFRPTDEDINTYIDFVSNFWSNFQINLDAVQNYSENKLLNRAEPLRNKRNGGNVLFRPVSLVPFVQAVILIRERRKESFSNIFDTFNDVNFTLNTEPWNQVLWNSYESKMIMGDKILVKLLFLFLHEEEILTAKEVENLLLKYKSALNYEGKSEDLLKTLK
jgi:DNA sulfur modification protein DndB